MQDDGVAVGEDAEHLAVRFRIVVIDPAQVLFQALGAVFDQWVVLLVLSEVPRRANEVPLIQRQLVEFGNEGLVFFNQVLLAHVIDPTFAGFRDSPARPFGSGTDLP